MCQTALRRDHQCHFKMYIIRKRISWSFSVWEYRRVKGNSEWDMCAGMNKSRAATSGYKLYSYTPFISLCVKVRVNLWFNVTHRWWSAHRAYGAYLPMENIIRLPVIISWDISGRSDAGRPRLDWIRQRRRIGSVRASYARSGSHVGECIQGCRGWCVGFVVVVVVWAAIYNRNITNLGTKRVCCMWLWMYYNCSTIVSYLNVYGSTLDKRTVCLSNRPLGKYNENE